ncbi:MAG: GAF domain-containing protein [SAR202 cluster bacterium]|jgi:signal transduction histidine kinase|nr:GAF domain-containing protein [SAR202 cluster bacterium]MDP6714726.1 GAF domain-containing protein [SAR202 cluster bacterium]
MSYTESKPPTKPISLNGRNFISSLGTSVEARRILALLVVAAVLLAAYPVARVVEWAGDTQAHTIVETVSTLLALMVGVIALVRYHSHQNTAFLLLGVGFAGTAFLDGYHATVTSEAFAELFPSVPSSLIPWSWFSSRLFLSVLMWLSWLAWLRERKSGQQRIIRERTVYASVTVLTIISFLFFTFVPLPRAYYPELLFPRPEEFLPALFFLAALIGYLIKGAWRKDTFEFCVVISLVIGVVGHALYMSSSSQIFDAEFTFAHLLKIITYLCVLAGLLISMHSLFRRADESAQALLKKTNDLTDEVALRERAEAVHRELSRENDALAEIGRIVNSSLDINEVFERTGQQVQKLIAFDRLAITLVDSEKGVFSTPHVSGKFIQGWEAGATEPLSGSAVEAIVLTRSGILANAQEMELLTKRFPVLHKGIDHGLASMIAVPLISNDDALGSLNLRSSDPNAYTEKDMKLAQRIAAQVAGAVANSQLHADLEREAHESEALAEVGRIISSSMKIDEVYERFTDELRKLIDFDRCSITLVDEEKRNVSVAFVDGTDPPGRRQGESTPFPGSNVERMGTTKKGEVIQFGDPNAENGEANDHFVDRPKSLPWIATAAHAPLIQGDGVIGALNLGTARPHAYSERDVALLERVANQIVGAIAIRHTYDQLADAQNELSSRNNDLETLLYVTSHDLREPLRAIENFTQIVKDRYTDTLDDKGHDFLRRVVRGAQRMNQLLEDILTLSRVQRMDQPSEWIPSKDIVREALQRLEAAIEQTGAEINVADSLPSLQVDRVWATQAVYNLVSNALKFTSNGDAPLIEIDAYHSAGEEPETGLVVRDRGIGIAPKHTKRVFKLFQRAVGREIEGTGAGLAIVSQIAERHGGRAWVTPRDGGGSEIFITFGQGKVK